MSYKQNTLGTEDAHNQLAIITHRIKGGCE